MTAWKRKLAPLALGTIPVLILADVVAVLTGESPSAQVHVLMSMALVGGTFWGTLPYGRNAAGAMAGAYAVLVVALYFLPFGELKDFIRQANHVLIGMTRQEAVQIMGAEPRQRWPHSADELEVWRTDGDTDTDFTAWYEPNGRIRRVELRVELPRSGRGGVVRVE